jgi:hypothetical protein
MQLETDIAEYILQHPEAFQDLKEVANSLIVICNEISDFKDEFNFQYEECVLSLIREYLSDCFSLNSEDLTVIITKEFIEKLLGKDYFKYEYKN